MPGEPDPRVETVWTLAHSQLASQMGAVDELRSRVGTLIAGAAVATGFLAGQALNTKHGVPTGAWLGISAAGALIVACVYILWPREWAGQALDVTNQLEYIDNRPAERIDEFQRYMTKYATEHLDTNERRLKQLYWLFSAALVCLCVDFAGWIWALVEQ